ncbi:predicted protein [Streptomyces viridosporus ATCC 14672]|uniref:Predicted protein n=1 Tax=Streptomyces viridosporus (strain ATCC 14672 / DSM 40746 / JCM 4963 / KCTC 9882 / NRRL B-12104 / FH 1290) TaxID=566461 RepID=D5ZVL3_STRV1|nr:predicted protein [Streptomyces viridosporus ATCC 14672]
MRSCPVTPGGPGCGVPVDSDGASLCAEGEVNSLAHHDTQVEK